MAQQQQQNQIPIQVGLQITETVLKQMEEWLRTQEMLGRTEGGYEWDSHPDRTALAIRSVHHTRLLLPLYLRHIIQKNAQKK